MADPGQPEVVTYTASPPRWPSGLQLRIAMLSDLHACSRWMPLPKVQAVVDRTRALNPDLILLPGDFPGHLPLSRPLAPAEVAGALARLSAPLGVFAVTGNHDWKDDRRRGATACRGRSGTMRWKMSAFRFCPTGIRSCSRAGSVSPSPGSNRNAPMVNGGVSDAGRRMSKRRWTA